MEDKALDRNPNYSSWKQHSYFMLYGSFWLCFPLYTPPHRWCDAPGAFFQAKEGSISWEPTGVTYCGRCTKATEPNSKEQVGYLSGNWAVMEHTGDMSKLIHTGCQVWDFFKLVFKPSHRTQFLWPSNLLKPKASSILYIFLNVFEKNYLVHFLLSPLFVFLYLSLIH